MNDETREQLSAYLDGAMADDERRELESRLAASAELRGALEDLRSVSRAIKDLTKEPLPPGFMTRFQGRRARGDAPKADWVFLPPVARPVVAAMSVGVVALMIWSKVGPAPQQALQSADTAPVVAPDNAPVAQIDLSRGVIAGAASSTASSDAKSLEIAGAAAAPAKPTDKAAVLENGGGGAADEMNASANSVAVVRGANARAVGAPIARPFGAAAEPQLKDRTQLAMTEEERSARNEELFAQLEGQKKQMGMRVLPKGDNSDEAHGGFLGLREPPAAPAITARAPALLQAKKRSSLARQESAEAAAGAAALPVAKPTAASISGRLAPDAGLVFTDAGSLAHSWVLLGLPGDPPSFDFANGRVVLIKPSATKILSVTPGADGVSVVFRSVEPDEESDPAKDRVAPLPASPKAVLIYDASPR